MSVHAGPNLRRVNVLLLCQCSRRVAQISREVGLLVLKLSIYRALVLKHPVVVCPKCTRTLICHARPSLRCGSGPGVYCLNRIILNHHPHVLWIFLRYVGTQVLREFTAIWTLEIAE